MDSLEFVAQRLEVLNVFSTTILDWTERLNTAGTMDLTCILVEPYEYFRFIFTVRICFSTNSVGHTRDAEG